MLFVIGVILVIIGVIIWFAVGAAAGRKAKLTGTEGIVNGIRALVSGGAVLLGLAAMIFSMIVIIQPGEVGVQILFGSAQDQVLTEGFHLVNPFVQVVKMDIRTQEYTMSVAHNEGEVQGNDAIEALTKDGLTVQLDVTVWYRLMPSKAVDVYRTVGTDYVNIIVRPGIRTALRDAATHYNAQEIYSGKRDDFVARSKDRMDQFVAGKGVVIERVLLRNVALPTKVTDAIEEKLKAEQEAQRMEFVLEKERKEAERKRVEAQGLADAQRIINETLTPRYLQYLYLTSIEKMAASDNTTFFIAPYDKSFLPLINVR